MQAAIRNTDRGASGRLSQQRVVWDILKAVQEGAKEFGIEPPDDFNSGTNEGSGFFEVKPGSRCPVECRQGVLEAGARSKEPFRC